jgi:hypothetical protein
MSSRPDSAPGSSPATGDWRASPTEPASTIPPASASTDSATTDGRPRGDGSGTSLAPAPSTISVRNEECWSAPPLRQLDASAAGSAATVASCEIPLGLRLHKLVQAAVVLLTRTAEPARRPSPSPPHVELAHPPIRIPGHSLQHALEIGQHPTDHRLIQPRRVRRNRRNDGDMSLRAIRGRPSAPRSDPHPVIARSETAFSQLNL